MLKKNGKEIRPQQRTNVDDFLREFFSPFKKKKIANVVVVWRIQCCCSLLLSFGARKVYESKLLAVRDRRFPLRNRKRKKIS